MNPLEDDESLSRRGFLVGSAGVAAAAGASQGALAEEDDENGDDGDDDDGEEEEGGQTETVIVGDNYFEPDSLTIEPGTTVEWVWEGEIQHDVTPDQGAQPEGADWEGHPELAGQGNTYEHTFEVEGTYPYICTPHPEMTAEIIVDPDAAQMATGPVDLVPDAAWTLVIASIAGMISTLSLVYVFMRYGGSPPE
ncbi:cupredoxin domain-containing protein [Natronobiforma cellulositropha]|uniref:cupredoxin domain-containing protein n=1 Tax=Natronobiforma cellulositropha TaxID=1679076 RepID=UPI0021D5F4BC|nr:plastocyanin/azurin family copper-binding protein [Natronobiforma cellulositropha]